MNAILNELFSVTIRFQDVRPGYEFLLRGAVYNKCGDREAWKVNYPGAGSCVSVERDEFVSVNELDAFGAAAEVKS